MELQRSKGLTDEELLNVLSSKLIQLKEAGAGEEELAIWQAKLEELIDKTVKDPTDISDYSAPYEDIDQPESAAAGSAAEGLCSGEYRLRREGRIR